MKIILRFIEESKNIHSIESTKYINNNFSRSKLNDNKELTYTLTNLDNKLEVLELKKFISKEINMEKDIISIYKIKQEDNFDNNLDNEYDIRNKNENNDLIYLLDNQNILNEIKNNNKDIIFFYKINKETSLIKIKIQYSLEKNKKFYINANTDWSIYILKSNLAEKLSISLGSINLVNIKNNKQYVNNDIISKIYENYLNYNENINDVYSSDSSDSESHCSYSINEADMCIKLINSTERVKPLGNFSYKNLEQIISVDFAENAPDHREASDGINIIAYCQNNKCEFYNGMFIIKLGKKFI
jgi:hypothetical protein